MIGVQFNKMSKGKNNHGVLGRSAGITIKLTDVTHEANPIKVQVPEHKNKISMRLVKGVYRFREQDEVNNAFNAGEMSGIKVKSHLESLMGTDVVKLNDRQYMLTLQEKLVKEHEQTINKQEELRSEKEKKRQRRLYIDGLQDLPNIDLRSTKEKQPKSKSAPTNGASRKIIAEDDETYMSRMGRQNPDRTRYTSYSERNRVTKSTPKASTQAEDSASDVYDHEDVHRHERFEHEDSDLDMTERGRLMKQLRREKTVDGLYTTADLVLAAPITELTDVVGNVRGSPRGSEYPMQEERKISGLALNSPTNKAAELVAVPEEELHPADADRATAVEDRAQADTLDRNNSAADTKISENFTLNAEPTGQS